MFEEGTDVSVLINVYLERIGWGEPPKQHILLRLNVFLALTQSEISRESCPVAGFCSQIVGTKSDPSGYFSNTLNSVNGLGSRVGFNVAYSWLLVLVVVRNLFFNAASTG